MQGQSVTQSTKQELQQRNDLASTSFHCFCVSSCVSICIGSHSCNAEDPLTLAGVKKNWRVHRAYLIGIVLASPHNTVRQKSQNWEGGGSRVREGRGGGNQCDFCLRRDIAAVSRRGATESPH